MIEVSLVRPQDVDGVWPLIAPAIIRCTEKTPTYHTAGDYWTMCRSGAGFLIVAHDGTDIKGASIWEFCGPRFVCRITVGRNMDAWREPWTARVIEVAQKGGATALAADGRPSLVKQLSKAFPNMKIVRHTFEARI